MKVAEESVNFRFAKNITVYSSETSGLFWRASPPPKSYKHGMKSSWQSELARIPGLAPLHINSPLEIVYFVSFMGYFED